MAAASAQSSPGRRFQGDAPYCATSSLVTNASCKTRSTCSTSLAVSKRRASETTRQGHRAESLSHFQQTIRGDAQRIDAQRIQRQCCARVARRFPAHRHRPAEGMRMLEDMANRPQEHRFERRLQPHHLIIGPFDAEKRMEQVIGANADKVHEPGPALNHHGGCRHFDHQPDRHHLPDESLPLPGCAGLPRQAARRIRAGAGW